MLKYDPSVSRSLRKNGSSKYEQGLQSCEVLVRILDISVLYQPELSYADSGLIFAKPFHFQRYQRCCDQNG